MLVLLQAKGISVSDEQRERILAMTEVAALERWVTRAASAQQLSDVLG